MRTALILLLTLCCALAAPKKKESPPTKKQVGHLVYDLKPLQDWLDLEANSKRDPNLKLPVRPLPQWERFSSSLASEAGAQGSIVQIKPYGKGSEMKTVFLLNCKSLDDIRGPLSEFLFNTGKTVKVNYLGSQQELPLYDLGKVVKY